MKLFFRSLAWYKFLLGGAPDCHGQLVFGRLCQGFEQSCHFPNDHVFYIQGCTLCWTDISLVIFSSQQGHFCAIRLRIAVLWKAQKLSSSVFLNWISRWTHCHTAAYSFTLFKSLPFCRFMVSNSGTPNWASWCSLYGVISTSTWLGWLCHCHVLGVLPDL